MVFYNFIVNLDWSGCLYNINLTKSCKEYGEKNMIDNEKYAVILYYNELFEENIENIENYLSRGVIVHLFLSSVFKEELELNEYDLDEFKLALDNNMLYVYENIEKLSDDDILISADGKILNKRLYEKICSKECDFNNAQYEIITADKDCNYIIVSGAGTGKTTTMINRFIYLKKISLLIKLQ